MTNTKKPMTNTKNMGRRGKRLAFACAIMAAGMWGNPAAAADPTAAADCQAYREALANYHKTLALGPMGKALQRAGRDAEDEFIKIYAAGRDTTPQALLSGDRRDSVLEAVASEFEQCPQ